MPSPPCFTNVPVNVAIINFTLAPLDPANKTAFKTIEP